MFAANPRFGSHVPRGHAIVTGGQPVPYSGMANKPWTKPGRAQYIGLPICLANFVTGDGVYTDPSDGSTWTTPSFFSTSNQDHIAGKIDVTIVGSGTFLLQRSLDNGVTWQTVETYTVPPDVATNVINANWGTMWRLGGSGVTGWARLSQA